MDECPDLFKANKEPKKVSKPISRGTKLKPEDVLAPFDEVFFDDELMDDLIVHTSVPELIRGEKPIYHGNILYGPPGTGKSVFQGAVCEAYDRAGAYAKQVSLIAFSDN